MYIYGSYRKIKTGVPLFWATLYSVYDHGTSTSQTDRRTDRQTNRQLQLSNTALCTTHLKVRKDYYGGSLSVKSSIGIRSFPCLFATVFLCALFSFYIVFICLFFVCYYYLL